MRDDAVTAGRQTAKVFVDPTDKFSFQVPEGWLVDTSGQQGSRAIVFGPTVEDDFRSNVNVVVQELGPLTTTEYLTLSRLQLKRLGNLTALPVDEAALSVPGGHVFEWTIADAPVPVRARQLIAFRAGKAIICTAMTTAGQFARYEPIFHSVLDSFQFC